MRFTKKTVLLALVITASTAGCSQEVSFKEDVLPILKYNCSSCHDGKGEGPLAPGFVLLTYDDLMKDTRYGPAVIPGDSSASPLYLMIDHRVDPMIQMPPHHNSRTDSNLGPLSRQTIATIATWIEEGAKNN